MSKKIKTFVLTVSQFFPSTHRRKGQETHFVEYILLGRKIHTIRGNYNLWKKRIDQVRNGDAVLSIRVWEGKPYNSKQREVDQITSKDLPGVQKVVSMERNGLLDNDFVYIQHDNVSCMSTGFTRLKVATNDGLSEKDFAEWFKGYKGEEMAIIHFTKFRY